MNNNIKCDLKIDGCGSSSGGVFNSVKINGEGKISGDVVCRMFRINGSGCINGNLNAEDGKINGFGKVEGSVKAQEFIINGSGQIKGGISGDNLIISGSTTIGENLDVQNVKLEGSAKIGRDCTAEIFNSCGSFEINGLLNADDIKIRLHLFKSQVTEMGGGKINVAIVSSTGLKVTKNTVNPVLESEIIEGDEIVLENTIAKEVRGTNVTIGRGCEIGLVEYKGIFRKIGDAKVEEERKV
ncbi:MAG TPA: polymer-forming cytoskeletal protein [Desulfitobacteriaceae bacterium]|nr:polymer-forming cytoskeletal protein [Desulfitobacteriaceae bacterium]